MRKYAARTDANQPMIVDTLRGMGATVAITASAGAGFPDLVVGYKHVNLLVEVKDPDQPTNNQKLTPKQVEFHAGWRGQICIVKTQNEAIELINQIILEELNEH